MAQFSFYEDFEYSISDALALKALQIAQIKSGGAPGEMLSISFALQCDQNLANLEISVSDLESATIPNATFSRGLVETYVAKVWAQAGIGFYRGASVEVAELLVKDDHETLRDGYSRACAHWKKPTHWRHLLRAPKFYRAPDVRSTGNAQTSLAVDETKQIWLVVKIPRDCESGIYRGQIELKFGAQTENLPIEIEVWPIQLLQPAPDFFIWYQGTLDCLMPRRHVSEMQFRAQLRDIYEHGFTSFSLSESRANLLQKALDIAHEIGFRRNVVLMEPWPANFDGIDFKDLTPLLYLSDEAELRGAAHIESHRANVQKARKLGFKTFASSTHQATSARIFNDGNEISAPDIASFYLSDNVHYFVFRSEFAKFQKQTAYYYWFSSMEKPNLHRVLAGLWLWKSRADGIAPYCYQNRPGAPFSAFDDFDGCEIDAPDADPIDRNRPTKDIMTTYPAASGSISTVQWKGIADGITDLKYLTTLEDALQKAETQPSSARQTTIEIRGRVDAFLQRIRLNGIEIHSATQSEPYPEISAREYRQFREQMARDIVLLQGDVSTSTNET